MRVIGGHFRGKKLCEFQGKGIRPTGDRLREAIFNILGNRIRDATVMDLYAGTGAFGIEALSRGAQTAMFIDNQRAAQLLIMRNIRACGLDKMAIIRFWDIQQSLNCLRSYRLTFNMVFMDPPYNKGMVKPTLSHLHDSRRVADNALIVIEHSQREHIPNDMRAYRCTDQRKYGKTIVSFLAYDGKPKQFNNNSKLLK